MLRPILCIAIAAVVLYAWGFLVWAVIPYPAVVWKKPVNEQAARKALKEQFPERGTYVVPAFDHDQAAKETLFKEGPVAMVHMTHPAGRPLADPAIMGGGFVLNLVGLVLIAIILRRVGDPRTAQGEGDSPLLLRDHPASPDPLARVPHAPPAAQKGTVPGGSAYWERVGFVALVGLTAAVLIDGGDAVWWQIPWPWKLYQAFYDFSFWLIAGLILARFIGAPKATRESRT